MRLKKQTADACPGRKEAKTQVFPCKGSLLCLPQFHDVPDVYPAGLCCGCMDKSHGNYEDVYSQIVLISTVAAIVTASVALLMMNFSRSGRTVDESRAWLKRICITWAILNSLGFIMAYITPFFADGKWNG